MFRVNWEGHSPSFFIVRQMAIPNDHSRELVQESKVPRPCLYVVDDLGLELWRPEVLICGHEELGVVSPSEGEQQLYRKSQVAEHLLTCGQSTTHMYQSGNSLLLDLPFWTCEGTPTDEFCSHQIIMSSWILERRSRNLL